MRRGKSTLTKLHRLLAAAVLIMAGTLVLASASAQQTTATIAGTISDESGAVLPGVQVTITNTETGISRAVTSDERGHYIAPLLAVGRYQLRSELAGFQSAVQMGITLVVGQETIVNVRMKVGEVSQTLEVTAATPLVETTSAALGGVVHEQLIVNLPLNGRNYTDLVYLEPGVQRSVRQTTAGGIHGDMTSVNGAGYRSLAYLVDGVYINDAYGMAAGSVAGTALGVDAVREFRVSTSTYSAEYGRNMAGVVSVVTKSGTNEFHGSVFEFLRNDNLDARNTFEIKKQEFKRNQFGASLGGPIKKDKTFFFATYEGLREQLGQPIVGFVPTAAARWDGGLVPVVDPAVKPFLRFWPVPATGTRETSPGSGIAQITLPFTQPTTENYLQGRVDHNFGSGDSVFVRYTRDPTFRTVALGAGFPPDIFPKDLKSRNHFGVGNYVKVLAPSLINTARVSYARTENASEGPLMDDPALNFLPGKAWGTVAVTGLTTIGQDQISPYILLRNLYDFSDDLVWNKGRHALKFGSQVGHFQDHIINSAASRGTWTFNSLADFLQKRPSQVTFITPGGILGRYYSYNIIGNYVQDDFRLTQNLTLNLGLRYEFQTEPTEKFGRISALVNPLKDTQYTVGKLIKNPSLKNFSPRFGFAWDPFKNGKMAVRGGFAMLQDTGAVTTALVMSVTTPPFAYRNVLAVSGPNSFPVINTAAVSSGPTGARAMFYDVKQPYIYNYNLNVERQISGDMVIRAGYVGSRGRHLVYVRDENPVLPDGIVNGRLFWSRTGLPRRNPAFAECICYEGFSESWYNALQLSLQKRLTRGLQFQSSYTWSKSIDLGQGQSVAEMNENGSSNPFDARADRGLSDFDVRHSSVSNVVYELPFGQKNWWGGWRLGSLMTLSTGTPFSVKLARGTSRSANQGGNGCCERAELKPGAIAQSVIRPGQRQYVDPVALANAFAPAQPGFIGNSGRNILTGPGLFTWDFSIGKQFPLQFIREDSKLEFRAEAFNLTNPVNYANPDPRQSFFAGTSPNDPVVASGTFSPRTKTPSRQLQFGLRWSF